MTDSTTSPGCETGPVTEYRHLHSGKVRDLYEAPDGLLLMVASDRISAFDHVLPTPIPDKGRILTQLSLWWFEQLADLVPNHVVSHRRAGRVRRPGDAVPPARDVPVECVARGYLAGSGLAEYLATGAVCGVPLPAGLVDGSRLPEPIFTPATKAAWASTTRTSRTTRWSPPSAPTLPPSCAGSPSRSTPGRTRHRG